MTDWNAEVQRLHARRDWAKHQKNLRKKQRQLQALAARPHQSKKQQRQLRRATKKSSPYLPTDYDRAMALTRKPLHLRPPFLILDCSTTAVCASILRDEAERAMCDEA